jgi:hypothetical protein
MIVLLIGVRGLIHSSLCMELILGHHWTDLSLVHDLRWVNPKADKDLIAQLREIHKATIQNLQDLVAKYKASDNKKRQVVEFEEGDFVCAILKKDRFPVGKYNKLAARKIETVKVIEKINSNAYRLKLLSHIKTSNIFNAKHLVSSTENTSDENVNSRENSLQLGRMM